MTAAALSVTFKEDKKPFPAALFCGAASGADHYHGDTIRAAFPASPLKLIEKV